ncbi:MAG: hypothetical protein K0R50_1557 [Eubacterium sp.]|nr:hypothetical protein [Eubacterium sp.]
MFNLIRSYNYSKKYQKIIYPIVEKRLKEYRAYSKRIIKLSIKSNAREALEKNRFDMAVSSICAFYPNVDMAAAADVMFSFQAIVQYLNTICNRSSSCTEPFLKVIFSSLKDALNLRADEFEKYFTFFPSKDDDGYLSILVEKCRQKVRLLPSYDIVRDHLSACLALYIDLQITKFSSDDNAKEVNLMKWSSIHGQKYPDLSNWEFCMAIDSSLEIQLLLALATEPELSHEKAETLNNSFFPWVCCIQKILEGYINYNDDMSSGDINYDFYYENLKEYENRIIFFLNKAVSMKAAYPKHIRATVKLLLSIYITHPKAEEGMNRITGKALLKAGGRGMFFYTNSVKLLRAKKYF